MLIFILNPNPNPNANPNEPGRLLGINFFLEIFLVFRELSENLERVQLIFEYTDRTRFKMSDNIRWR